MNQLLEMLLGQANQSNIQDIANRFGIDESQAGQAISALLPQITQGIRQQAQADNGDIMQALQSGQQQRFMDDDNARLYEDEAVEEGNSILGQIFGDKETSRQVASQAAEQTGLDSSSLKQMLPMVASMAMGSLSKQANSGGGNMMSSLTSMLDQDGDGSIVDDVMGIAGRFFK